MELAERTDESAEDITAADTAPSPMNVTQDGHMYCMTIGRISLRWPSSSRVMFFSFMRSVSFQSMHTERRYDHHALGRRLCGWTEKETDRDSDTEQKTQGGDYEK